MKQKIKIYHLYPREMNLYGDLGNIIAIQKRCQWRGIDAEVINVNIGDKVDFSEADLLFMGGGQDRGQKIIAGDLQTHSSQIKNEIEKGMPALLICGGFQLFGHYFQTLEGDKLPGIGVFDVYTIGDKKRLIGNVVVDIAHKVSDWTSDKRIPMVEAARATLVGFENHSGRTILNPQAESLGNVIKGYGNEGNGGLEGCVYKNAYGTYLHGSLLPKNPWFTDYLITVALLRRYGSVEKLSKLDDTIEVLAHEAAIKRAYSAKTLSI